MMGDGEPKKNVASTVFAMLVIVVIVFGALWIAIAINWPFLQTYTLPASSPGTLTTSTGSYVYWMILVVSLTRYGFAITISARSSDAHGPVLRYVTTFVCLIALAAEVVAVVLLSLYSEGCNNSPDSNHPGQDAMLCNDFRWCCVYGNVTNCPLNNFTVPYCPVLLTACAPAVIAENLHWNWVYATSYALAYVFIVLTIAALLLSSWMGNGRSSDLYSDLAMQDEYSPVDSKMSIDGDVGDTDRFAGLSNFVTTQKRKNFNKS
jgi:ABC-type multidrug transport system fused ATPase/permease subunit